MCKRVADSTASVHEQPSMLWHVLVQRLDQLGHMLQDVWRRHTDANPERVVRLSDDVWSCAAHTVVQHASVCGEASAARLGLVLTLDTMFTVAHIGAQLPPARSDFVDSVDFAIL